MNHAISNNYFDVDLVNVREGPPYRGDSHCLVDCSI